MSARDELLERWVVLEYDERNAVHDNPEILRPLAVRLEELYQDARGAGRPELARLADTLLRSLRSQIKGLDVHWKRGDAELEP